MQAAISNPSWSGGDALAPGERLPVVVGELVGGKYKVDQILGMGGMAVVASATHTELGQRIALKVMRQPRTTPESVERFLTEARAAVSLKSHHVTKVLDVGTLPSGLPYMVMELLEGCDFATILERDGVLRPNVAIEYVIQACDAIGEAHRAGIIHRDLKPENLYLTQRHDGTPLIKVLDFGISKITAPINITESAQSRRAITHESTLMGSPMYMSPEQVRSAKDVDHRTDIWALGAILYELVTGHRAFEAENVADIFVKVLDKPTPSLQIHLPNPPPGLPVVIARCLEKDRKKRYATVGAFVRALKEVIGSTSQPNIIIESTPNVAAWDRQINLNVDPLIARGAGAARGVGVGSQPTPNMAMPVHVNRKTYSETFVLPGRRTSPFALLAVAAAIVSTAIVFGVYQYRHHAPKPAKIVATAAVATPTATAPLPSSTDSSSSSSDGVTGAQADEGLSSQTTPATSSSAKRKKKPKNATAGSAGTAASDPTPAETAPAPTPPAPAPAPTTSSKLQRTEW